MLKNPKTEIIEGDKGGLQAFAFAYGYIRGLMQATGA